MIKYQSVAAAPYYGGIKYRSSALSTLKFSHWGTPSGISVRLLTEGALDPGPDLSYANRSLYQLEKPATPLPCNKPFE